MLLYDYIDIYANEDLHCGCILILNQAVILVRQKVSQTLFTIFQIKSGTNITSLYRPSVCFFAKRGRIIAFSLWGNLQLQYNLNYKRMCDFYSFCHMNNSRLYVLLLWSSWVYDVCSTVIKLALFKVLFLFFVRFLLFYFYKIQFQHIPSVFCIN